MSMLGSPSPQHADPSLLNHKPKHAHPIGWVWPPHLAHLVPELESAIAPPGLPLDFFKMHVCGSHGSLDPSPR
eukprot:5599311-Karenia_brevis.AAC.1